MTLPAELFVQDTAVVRKRAEGLPPNRSDALVYGLLAACTHLCDRLERDNLLIPVAALIPEEYQKLHKRKASFTTGTLDAEMAVGCLVFGSRKEVDIARRYIDVLRNLRKAGVKPDEVFMYLANNGGVTGVYQGVPVAAKKEPKKRRLSAVPKTGRSTA